MCVACSVSRGVQVKATFQCLPDDSGLRVQVRPSFDTLMGHILLLSVGAVISCRHHGLSALFVLCRSCSYTALMAARCQIERGDLLHHQISTTLTFVPTTERVPVHACVLQFSAVEGEEESFTAETFLPIDDARMILSLNQKKKGPLSKAELVTLVTGLMENFELMETAGTISIIFRRKLEFSNEDQFFSMVNKNLTALQQLYIEQREEVSNQSHTVAGVAEARR